MRALVLEGLLMPIDSCEYFSKVLKVHLSRNVYIPTPQQRPAVHKKNEKNELNNYIPVSINAAQK